MSDTSPVRHRYATRHGPDADYASKTHPLARTPENPRAGRALDEPSCAACHGPAGRAGGRRPRPPPADLAAVAAMAMARDGHLYWSIAEGGVPIGTRMPAFKGSLAERGIRPLIRYRRSLPESVHPRERHRGEPA